MGYSTWWFFRVPYLQTNPYMAWYFFEAPFLATLLNHSESLKHLYHHINHHKSIICHNHRNVCRSSMQILTDILGESCHFKWTGSYHRLGTGLARKPGRRWLSGDMTHSAQSFGALISQHRWAKNWLRLDVYEMHLLDII